MIKNLILFLLLEICTSIINQFLNVMNLHLIRTFILMVKLYTSSGYCAGVKQHEEYSSETGIYM
jgi:hypothetical protein